MTKSILELARDGRGLAERASSPVKWEVGYGNGITGPNCRIVPHTEPPPIVSRPVPGLGGGRRTLSEPIAVTARAQDAEYVVAACRHFPALAQALEEAAAILELVARRALPEPEMPEEIRKSGRAIQAWHDATEPVRRARAFLARVAPDKA